ncbi:unnamed protein product [Rhizoctonia solani]|nr:unnamed protein product [Rhizoctonia solani]
MGEIYESEYPADETLKLGTYRIFNVNTRSAIQVSDHDPTKIVAWEQHDGENQQWYLQRAGHGYQLQNKLHDAYLAVSNTNNHGLVYASRYPTTWVFLKFDGNYSIQLADRNRVLDLNHNSAHNGNEIHIWDLGGSNIPQKVWALERCGGDLEPKPQGEFTNKSIHQGLDLLICYPSFTLGLPAAYGYLVVAITVVILLSLPLYHFIRRIFDVLFTQSLPQHTSADSVIDDP